MYINRTQIKKTKQWKDLNLWLDYYSKKNQNLLPQHINELFYFTDSNFTYGHQEKHRFNKSKSLIEYWITLKGKPNNIRKWKLLLILSNEFSQLRRSVFSINLFSIAHQNEYSALKSICYSLGLENKIPKVFIEHLELWDEIDFKFIIHILDGKSIREFPEIYLSKKEAHLIFTTDSYDIFRNQGAILQNYVSFCKILKSNSKDKNYIEYFFSNSFYLPSQKDNITKYYKFWNSIYDKLSKWSFKETDITFNEIIDYITFKRETEPNFNLKGRNIYSISRAIRIWHRELYMVEHFEYKGITWKGSAIENTTLEIDSKTYYFTQITTGGRLYKEGNNLEHCVLTYINQFVSGKSSIWNFHIENENSKNDLTIQIDAQGINQIAGLRNRKATVNERYVIDQFKKKMKLDLDKL